MRRRVDWVHTAATGGFHCSMPRPKMSKFMFSKCHTATTDLSQCKTTCRVMWSSAHLDLLARHSPLLHLIYSDDILQTLRNRWETGNSIHADKNVWKHTQNRMDCHSTIQIMSSMPVPVMCGCAFYRGTTRYKKYTMLPLNHMDTGVHIHAILQHGIYSVETRHTQLQGSSINQGFNESKQTSRKVYSGDLTSRGQIVDYTRIHLLIAFMKRSNPDTDREATDISKRK